MTVTEDVQSIATQMQPPTTSDERRRSDRPAALLLPDGTRIIARGIGPTGITAGELVFTTSMTGYEEALTDPSYRGQILLFTYPLIGNYGSFPGRAQSSEIQVRAAIVSTLSDPWPGCDTIRDYLEREAVPAMYGVDTRMLAQWVRKQGAAPVALSIHQPGAAPSEEEMRGAMNACDYDDIDFIAETTVRGPEIHGRGGGPLIALLDCGNKRKVVDDLVHRRAQVVCMPASTPAADILALRPDGVVISNGPGNPQTAGPIIDTIRALFGKTPLFGICLGHQLLALAAGGRTYKLKFGHRGANHPVQDRDSGRAFVTTQNHGYAVDPASLPADLLVSHRNLNDGTIEGLAHRTLPIRSVQFHPEGAPGPTDSSVVLDAWLEALA